MAKSTISNDPVREQDKFMLRLPEGMRDKIRESADENGRSMNAEIIDRIEKSFLVDLLTTKNAELEGRAEALQVMLGESMARAAAFHKQADEENHILYVLLDADGFPVSWQEVMLHLSEIQKAYGMKIDTIDAHVLSPEKRSNSSAEERWLDLATKYRALAKNSKEKPSRLISGRALDLGDDEGKGE